MIAILFIYCRNHCLDLYAIRNKIAIKIKSNELRGNFLEHRAISAQKYCDPLRENEAFCCFCKSGR